MTLTLHHLGQSRSERIIWLLEELGAPYELVVHKRDAATRLAPAALADIHPLGKAPLLVLDDGRALAETGAIAQYLLDRFDIANRLRPVPQSPAWPVYLEWMHASEGAVFLPFLMNAYLRPSGLMDSPLGQYMAAERAKILAHVDAHLAAHAWFAGETFSAADCLMGFQLEAADQAGAISEDSPVKDWLERIRARPAHQAMRQITAKD
ncbi:glutathione S-transferase family protein [Alkalicaulis satelles]|uniref:Glutathione S-transferase family protein n=1 Tax=Alkalicaulis satelles TaxID=2609175 RepID=A0A5M6ZN21_9PROT|nr:glutathione S-transferase family protein [Alkalicaulis satelles]KAA5805315.1 glutathione S-transferase family protein [Alkalicaulis satelles]